LKTFGCFIADVLVRFWCGWCWGVQIILLKACWKMLFHSQCEFAPEFRILRTIPSKIHLPRFLPHCSDYGIFCESISDNFLVQSAVIIGPNKATCILRFSLSGINNGAKGVCLWVDFFLYWHLMQNFACRSISWYILASWISWDFQIRFMSGIVSSKYALMGFSHWLLSIFSW